MTKFLLFFILALIAMASCREDRCLEAIQPGRCEAYIPSYAFDQSTGQCREFIYGGCGGTGNRFDELADCENACLD